MATASLEAVEPVERRAPLECREDEADEVGALVCQALLKEVELTPKPGLVDGNNSGAHRDMNRTTFHASIKAIAPWFPVFYRIGACTRDLAPEAVLTRLRPAGLACESAMFRATGNVNTHKGSIFSMGLLCAAAGRLDCGNGLPDRERLCAEVARICSGLVEAELLRIALPRTAGEKLFQAHGLTGVRGEAASGFKTVREHGLPAFARIMALGGGEEEALHEALLHLLAVNHDTNLVHRGGLEGLAHVQVWARRLIEAGGVRSLHFEALMLDFDRDLIERNLSPGGSADLLAVTWFLSRFPEAGSRRRQGRRQARPARMGIGY
jgi:triphosphoribosyl-dephospho-CoA synthase